MRSFFLLVCLFSAASCGGKTTPPDGNGDDAGPFGRGPDSGDGGNGYIDPHCPDATPPTEIMCNVFDPNGCMGQGQSCCDPGSACYPVTIPPQGKCATETYGAFCLQVGPGTQGASCNGTENCASGFVCLITGTTTQCAKLCDLNGSHGCSEGFVCEPIDVPGFSACL